MMPCSPLNFNRHFGGAYGLHLQGRKQIIQETNVKTDGFCLLLVLSVVSGSQSVPTVSAFLLTVFHFPLVSYIIWNFGKPVSLLPFLKTWHLLSRWFLCLTYPRPWIWRRRVSSETSVDFSQVIRRYIHNHCRDNLIAYKTFFLAYFPDVDKLKWAYANSMLSVCLLIPIPIKFWMPEPIFMKLGKYIMATDPISTACYKNLSHQPACLYVLRHSSKHSYSWQKDPVSIG
jgi:hypothetical protein